MRHSTRLEGHRQVPPPRQSRGPVTRHTMQARVLAAGLALGACRARQSPPVTVTCIGPGGVSGPASPARGGTERSRGPVSESPGQERASVPRAHRGRHSRGGDSFNNFIYIYNIYNKTFDTRLLAGAGAGLPTKDGLGRTLHTHTRVEAIAFTALECPAAQTSCALASEGASSSRSQSAHRQGARPPPRPIGAGSDRPAGRRDSLPARDRRGSRVTRFCLSESRAIGLAGDCKQVTCWAGDCKEGAVVWAWPSLERERWLRLRGGGGGCLAELGEGELEGGALEQRQRRSAPGLG